jgi:hypothetical protein
MINGRLCELGNESSGSTINNREFLYHPSNLSAFKRIPFTVDIKNISLFKK